MRILTMTATFGCLQNATLSLEKGLNLLEMPNEGGKSTWCAFLRAMLYGLESGRGKSLSEKSKYTPWSGAPMAGSMDILWDTKSITLRRFSKGSTPFGNFQAVFTGTEEPVPGLTGDNVGEVLLGCGREVFERTCFISQGKILVDPGKNGDLERRVASLATAGEEDVSYSKTAEILKKWRNQRQSNKISGTIPKLQGEIALEEGQIARILEAKNQLEETRKALETLGKQRLEVQRDLARHTALQAAAYRQRYDRAKAGLESAKALGDKALADLENLPSPSELHEVQGEISYLDALKQRSAEAESRVTQCRQGLAGLPPVKFKVLPLLLGLLLGGLLVAIGWVNGGQAVGGRWATGGLLVGLCCGAAAILAGFSISLLLTRRERQSALQAAQNQLDMAVENWKELEGQRQGLLEKLLDFGRRLPGAPTDVEGLKSALEAAFQRYAAADQAGQRLAAAREVWTAVSAAGVPGKVPEDLEKPQFPLEEDKSRLQKLDAALDVYARRKEQLSGALQTMGDLSALEGRLAEQKGELGRQMAQLNALNLAMEVLEEANGQLQTKFSPAVGKAAGKLLERLTLGKYDTLSFTKSFETSTTVEGQSRPAKVLSQGTADQVYLALRLAICLLTFPAHCPPPLVLDDALVTFDDGRLREALGLLKELGEERQILLFTCQSREGKLV